MNYLSNGNAVIQDSVSALGVWIAFYYGLTGLSCAWYFRTTLRESPTQFVVAGHPAAARRRDVVVRHGLGPLVLLEASQQLHLVDRPHHHWDIGGVFVLDIGSVILGMVLMFVYASLRPAYFRGEVLNRDTPTRVPSELGVPVGLFGIEPYDEKHPAPAGVGGLPGGRPAGAPGENGPTEAGSAHGVAPSRPTGLT